MKMNTNTTLPAAESDSPGRTRLPNRRPSMTATLEAAGQTFDASIGFDTEDQPREVFLRTARDGSQLNALLADAAVVISVALQHGITPAALAKSVGRIPGGAISPTDLDHPRPERAPASPIGRALDLLASCGGGSK